MITSILPDRQRRHLLQFYVAPKIDYRRRLIGAFSLVLLGLLIQFFWQGESVATMLFLTIPLLAAGSLLLLVQGYHLKPDYRVTRGEWEKTTRDRFAQARALESQGKRWDETFIDLTCASGVVFLLMLAVPIAVITTMLASSDAHFWAVPFVVDVVVLLLPHWLTGTRRAWRPVALRQQIDSLEIALKTIESYDDPPCQIQPMFEMAGKGSRRTPIAARVFIRYPDESDEFLGLQFQVAVNDVQGTKYPYLYAVIVAKPSFGLLDRHLAEIRKHFMQESRPSTGWSRWFKAQTPDSLTIESSREPEVEVIILRQKTTKNSGYHTNPVAVRNLARTAWESVTQILSPHAEKL